MKITGERNAYFHLSVFEEAKMECNVGLAPKKEHMSLLYCKATMQRGKILFGWCFKHQYIFPLGRKVKGG